MIEERVTEVERLNSEEKNSKRPSTVTEQAWQRAVTKAKESEKENKRNHEERVVESTSRSGNEETTEKSWNTLPAQRGTSILRQRANASVIERRSSKSGGSTTKTADKDTTEVVIRDSHPLATHPDHLISGLAREVENIREDLTSSPSPNITTTEEGVQRETYTKTVIWPENITIWNFFDYLLVPTLVYELSYPRTKAIRPLYLLEKVLATFGTFFVIYVITEHWIIPKQPDPSTPLLRTFLELAVPMMINYLLIF